MDRSSVGLPGQEGSSLALNPTGPTHRGPCIPKMTQRLKQSPTNHIFSDVFGSSFHPKLCAANALRVVQLIFLQALVKSVVRQHTRCIKQCLDLPFQVAFQGTPHYHTLAVRDRFGNLLDSYADGGFAVSLIGIADPRAAVATKLPVTIETTVSKETDATGELSASFTPRIAGSYVMSNAYTGPGGLLATFYRTKDFTDPVLENLAYATEVKIFLLHSNVKIFFSACVSLHPFPGYQPYIAVHSSVQDLAVVGIPITTGLWISIFRRKPGNGPRSTALLSVGCAVLRLYSCSMCRSHSNEILMGLCTVV